MSRRTVRLASAAALAALALTASPSAPARGEGQETRTSSVAAVNGVVVHGVDTKLLASRLREIDVRLVEGADDTAAAGLASLSTADDGTLVEEGEGVWLSASEAVLQRVSSLSPAGLKEYRRLLDGAADAALERAASRSDASSLSRDAARLAFTTAGPRLLLLLADLRLAHGDLGGAARALEDLIRLLDGVAPPERVAEAASRLAAIQAAQGDGPGVRGLVGDLDAAVLDSPAPTGTGSLRDELGRAASHADRRTAQSVAGPAGALHVDAELGLPSRTREAGVGPTGRDPGTLRDFPLPIGTADAPALLVRFHDKPGRQSHVIAITPAAAREPGATGESRPAAFRPLWSWPSSVAEEPRAAEKYVFAPARLADDIVIFTWPVPPGEGPLFSDRYSSADERHELVALSLSAQGKLVDERGRAQTEAERTDGDIELETLSFSGRPTVDGRSVYTTAFRTSAQGPQTELHVCRFDFVPESGGGRLVLRWRRHVLDGRPMPSAVFKAREFGDANEEPAIPTPPLVRAGRVFVGSNSGAVASLDAMTGRVEWVETYERFGPSQRTTVREAELGTWDDGPLVADGPWLWAAPRDGDSLLQFRRAPRKARSVRIENFDFAGPNGTARQSGPLLPGFVPTRVAGVRDGVAYLSGRIARRPFGSSPAEGSPLAAFRLDERRALVAQIQEYAAAGAPCLVRGALLFPSPKAIYRVALDDFEGTPQVLWTNAGGGDPFRGQDRIGNLVPDGERLWSVTPSRILLLAPVPK